jgi:hypothetical protein
MSFPEFVWFLKRPDIESFAIPELPILKSPIHTSYPDHLILMRLACPSYPELLSQNQSLCDPFHPEPVFQPDHSRIGNIPGKSKTAESF